MESKAGGPQVKRTRLAGQGMCVGFGWLFNNTCKDYCAESLAAVFKGMDNSECDRILNVQCSLRDFKLIKH